MYYRRLIDKYLSEWASRKDHKPVLLRGARQVGKSTAVHNLGKQFENYVEINFEKSEEMRTLFKGNLDVQRIASQMSAMCGTPIVGGKTLLFFDEIQACPEAIMSLRFFKEDMPELHVIAAGSLLEFALDELPTFGVGRIHSMFMYPMTFDEFLMANGEDLLIETRDNATSATPLPTPLHNKLVNYMRTYMLVGGMPEVVAKWAETHDYLQCQEIQDDIIVSYEDDFPKYRTRVDATLLRMTMRSVAVQATKKFVFTQVSGNYSAKEVKSALELLTLAGIITPVTRSSANGLPLGSEADCSYRKFLLLDPGLMLRLLNITLGSVQEITTDILTATAADLVNRGTMAEMIAGLELFRYRSLNIRYDLYYWLRMSKNSQAEIDYLATHNQKILPIEVKAGTQGGMKSLWTFMREKNLDEAVRCSLENFGEFEYCDKEADNAMRHVQICPLYAMRRISRG
jgi:hypothetical protein